MSFMKAAEDATETGHFFRVWNSQAQDRFASDSQMVADCGAEFSSDQLTAESDVNRRCELCRAHSDGLGRFKACDDPQHCDPEDPRVRPYESFSA